MRKLVLAALAFGVAIAAAAAPAAAPTLAPHIYTVRITGASVPALNGSWRLSVGSAAFGIERNHTVVVSGTLKIVGAKVTFHDVAGPLACKGAQVNGTYGWKLAGRDLKLTRFTDSCVGRRTVLSFPFRKLV